MPNITARAIPLQFESTSFLLELESSSQKQCGGPSHPPSDVIRLLPHYREKHHKPGEVPCLDQNVPIHLQVLVDFWLQLILIAAHCPMTKAHSSGTMHKVCGDNFVAKLGKNLL